MFIYPVFKLIVLAIILTFVVGNGTFWEQPQAQTISPINKANREASPKNRYLATSAGGPVMFPSHQATMVNPDVQLKLTFRDTPRVGTSGKIRIYDASNDRLVDTLDMSIPPGPTKPVDPAVHAKNYLALPYPYT